MSSKDKKSFAKTKVAAAAKSKTAKSSSSTSASTDTNVYVAKLGESKIPVVFVEGMTVFECLKNCTFPEGAIMTKNGKSITNIVDAAQADVSAGRKRSIQECIKDIRVNAVPASLETKLNRGDLVQMVPDIDGGSVN